MQQQSANGGPQQPVPVRPYGQSPVVVVDQAAQPQASLPGGVQLAYGGAQLAPVPVQQQALPHYIQQSFRTQSLSLRKKPDERAENGVASSSSDGEELTVPVKMMMTPAKRKRCATGQVFNAEQKECVDFALAKK